MSLKFALTSLCVATLCFASAAAFAQTADTGSTMTVGGAGTSLPTVESSPSRPQAPAANRSVGGAGTASTISDDMVPPATTDATDRGTPLDISIGSTTNVTAGAPGSSSQATGGVR